MKRIFFVLLLGALLLPVFSVRAADTELIPEFNPICWEKEACVAARKQFNPDATQQVLEGGWLQGEEPCNKTGWGKCLPAGVTETQIKFGGQTTFKDIGEFLFVNYNYIISVVGILAAIMIIIAGVQWVTSAGSSEAISSAKKRIGGALIGLLIAYLSYVILSTINPALVNLRLPQTFMVRSSSIVPDYCSKIPSSTSFAFAAEPGELVDKDKYKTASFDLTFSRTKEFACGRQFYVKNSGGNTCVGDFCEPRSDSKMQLCAPDYKQPTKNLYVCRAGLIGGKVAYNSLEKEIHPLEGLKLETWDYPAINVGESELWAVCEDRDTTDVSNGDYGGKIDDKNQTYLIDADVADLDEAAKRCAGSHKGLRGFVLMFEMNENWDPKDEAHLVGFDNGSVVDLGDQGFFLKNADKINKKYFISLEKLKDPSGMLANVDAEKIYDMDESADYKVYDYLFK